MIVLPRFFLYSTQIIQALLKCLNVIEIYIVGSFPPPLFCNRVFAKLESKCIHSIQVYIWIATLKTLLRKRHCYLFFTLAVIRTLIGLKDARLPVVLGHLYQGHRRLHCGVASMDKHHHLRHTQTRQEYVDTMKSETIGQGKRIKLIPCSSKATFIVNVLNSIKIFIICTLNELFSIQCNALQLHLYVGIAQGTTICWPLLCITCAADEMISSSDI